MYSKMTKTTTSIIISLWTYLNLFLLHDKLTIATATVHSSANSTTIGIQITNNNTNQSSLQYNYNNKNTNKEEVWYNDLWNLPSDVPLPGTSWLSRMALSLSSSSSEYSSSLLITYQGQQYNNIYEAIVFGIPSSSSSVNIVSENVASQNQATNEKEQKQKIDNINNNHPCRNLNAYINSIFIPPYTAHYIVHYIAFDNIELGHYIICYIRNLIAAMIIYYGVGILFHYGCYVFYKNSVFNHETGGRKLPTTATILHQIRLAQSSLPIYVLLPVLDEYLIENNYTYVYYTIDEIGGYMNYIICQILYFTLVEISIYWIHRTLHTNKWMYMNIHLKHHQYNKIDTLTPWASLAFYPLDGILQASPYVFVLFIMPCHYVTHMLLLFFTAFWATYIHDAMEWNIYPIMGSAYHTIHHTHYKYNFGQVFIFCDYYWNTLYLPTSSDKHKNNNIESKNKSKKHEVIVKMSTNSMKTKQQ